MSSESETTSEEGDQRRVEVRRCTAIPQLRTRRIIQAVKATLGEHSPYDISVAVVDDATMSSLHLRYMSDPQPTDVMSFDLGDGNDADLLEGEIIVSADTARRQAAELNVDFKEELLRYVIHGALHLIGYDDHTTADRKAMRRQEDRILAELARLGQGSGGRSNGRTGDRV